jgi:hypothetical protein
VNDSRPDQEEAIDEVIQEAREAVMTIITLIDTQEISPMMLRDEMVGVLARLDEVVTEAWYMKNSVHRVNGMAQRLRDQRDEVLAQRDSLARFIRDLYPEADDYGIEPPEDEDE